VERGSGTPLVLLHGNGSMIQDFQTSGLIELAAKRYRVIAFDRPGYGYSDRPGNNLLWTPEAQADLVNAALEKLGASRAIILGHSWGAMVALALALHHPQAVRGLVLASGYYFPAARADVFAMSAPALPLLGHVLSYTVWPLLSRLLWPLLLRRTFGPNAVPRKFDSYPEEMAVRPSQIRASAAESALMMPGASNLRRQYDRLRMPVVIIAGVGDKVVEADQAAELHREIGQSTLRLLPETGHMVHQVATAEVMAAIDSIAGQHDGRILPRVAA
jgi:pimeloyl-ACP methyl ester carboxylesterase